MSAPLSSTHLGKLEPFSPWNSDRRNLNRWKYKYANVQYKKIFKSGRFFKNYNIQHKVPYSLTAYFKLSYVNGFGPDKFSDYSEGEITSKFVVKAVSIKHGQRTRIEDWV